MIRVKTDPSTSRYDLASIVRGLHGRVARDLDLDPSYVSRVARGELQSEAMEAALEREMKRIIQLVGMNHNGANHDGAKKKPTAKKRNKKALQ
jgi:hypothetical protein